MGFPTLDLAQILSIAAAIGAFSGIVGFLMMRKKFLKELNFRKTHEEELARKVYETEVLREIGERIGYSLDTTKIIEIISDSLGSLLPYSTVSYIVLDDDKKKIRFSCQVKESVSPKFVRDVKVKMLAAFSEMTQKALIESDLDESITGAILDEKAMGQVVSFFNLPIVILGEPMGIINIASGKEPNLYNEENTEVLYRIARLASEAVSKLQEVLENEKSRLLAAVQSLSDGLLMVDTQFQLVLVNKKLAQLLGTTSEPSIFDIVNSLAGRFDLRTKMEEVISGDLATTNEEIYVRDKVLQVMASRVSDAKGEKAAGIVFLFHDITDAKSIEKLRRGFMAMMVHELRAPLTTIKSTAEVTMEELSKMPQGETLKNLRTIDSTSYAMLELVNDLLDVAKLEAGKFDVVCDNADLGDSARERIEAFEAQAKAKNLKLNLEVSEKLPFGYFDKIRIKQVFNNLLSNALKYTDRGEVKVKVAPEFVDGLAVDILVSVSDTGIGIEPGEINNLFSKFSQLSAGRSNAGLKSSGLGLFIAKGIVEAWGGKIWVQSQGSGLGSTFYFTVPVANKRETIPEAKLGGPVVSVKHAAQA